MAMEEMVVSKEGNVMVNDFHPMVRSDQECESQHPLWPTHVLRSVISSTLSSHTQLHQQASAISSLQSKVKARSESKAVWKQLSKKKKDGRFVPGFDMPACSHKGFWDLGSSDEDMEANGGDSAINNFNDNSIATSMGQGEEVFLANITDNICNTKQDRLRTPPEGFWRIGRQEPLLLNGDDFPGRVESGVMPRRTTLRTDTSIQGEMKCSDMADRHLQSCKPGDSGPAVTTGSELWHAESTESICSNGSSLSLAERVEMNRTILRQMLQKAQKKSSEAQQATRTNQEIENTHSGGGLNDSHWDSGISLQDSEQIQRDLHSWVRAPVQQAPLLGMDRVVAGLENISDSSSSDSTGGSRCYRSHGQSPTRVRFQDESEKDAEVRYLERQRRRAGERAHGLLGAKPSLATYINRQRPEDKFKSRGRQENLLNTNRNESKTMSQQCNSRGTIFDGDCIDPNFFQKQPLPDNSDAESKMIPCWVAPTLPNHLVRIEPIKETYIGAMSPVIVESDGTHCRAAGSVGSGSGAIQKQGRKSQKGDGRPETRATAANGLRDLRSASICTNTPVSNGTVHLPSNPYAFGSLELKGKNKPCKHLDNFNDCVPFEASRGKDPESRSLPSAPQSVAPSLQPKTSALSLESSSDQQVMLPQQINTVQECGQQLGLKGIPEGNTGLSETTVIHKHSIMEELAGANSNDHKTITAGLHGSQTAGLEQDRMTSSRMELAASPANTSVITRHVVQQQEEDRPRPSVNLTSDSKQKEGKAQHALRRFFSAMGLSARGQLSKGHSSSMEQLGPPLKPRINSLEIPGHPLKKAPSLQNLRLASPFCYLKKSSSAQNLQSPKRKHERSNVYSPGKQPCSPALSRGLQRALSVEDVGSPCAVRSVGRVAQAFPDGTLLLELNRPPDRPLGFLISRGKDRPDSGVYVEDMEDISMQKLYAGLLGVGDELLEVNGEKVTGLSLDLVTKLIIQSETVYIRVLRQQPPHR